jgi:23S rRNA A1618 N6-methylase RlmF
VLATNEIDPKSISVLEVPPTGGILFPLLDDKDLQVDMIMCNPPFYSSSEELQQGVEMKEDGPHAVRPRPLSKRNTDSRLQVARNTSLSVKAEKQLSWDR